MNPAELSTARLHERIIAGMRLQLASTIRLLDRMYTEMDRRLYLSSLLSLLR